MLKKSSQKNCNPPRFSCPFFQAFFGSLLLFWPLIGAALPLQTVLLGMLGITPVVQGGFCAQFDSFFDESGYHCDSTESKIKECECEEETDKHGFTVYDCDKESEFSCPYGCIDTAPTWSSKNFKSLANARCLDAKEVCTKGEETFADACSVLGLDLTGLEACQKMTAGGGVCQNSYRVFKHIASDRTLARNRQKQVIQDAIPIYQQVESALSKIADSTDLSSEASAFYRELLDAYCLERIQACRSGASGKASVDKEACLRHCNTAKKAAESFTSSCESKTNSADLCPRYLIRCSSADTQGDLLCSSADSVRSYRLFAFFFFVLPFFYNL